MIAYLSPKKGVVLETEKGPKKVPSFCVRLYSQSTCVAVGMFELMLERALESNEHVAGMYCYFRGELHLKQRSSLPGSAAYLGLQTFKEQHWDQTFPGRCASSMFISTSGANEHGCGWN